MNHDHRSLKALVLPTAISVSLFVFIVRAACPGSWEKGGLRGVPMEIVFLNPSVRVVLDWAPLAALGVLALIAVTLFWQKRRFDGILLFGLGLFGFLGSWVVFVVSSFASWHTCDTVRGPDGEVYSFLDSSFLQCQRMVITRQTHCNWLARWESVLGMNNGDNPRSWASVIRPSDAVSDQYGRLYIAESEWLLGMRKEDHCYLAYHIPTLQFYGHGDIEALSPFLLLQSNSRPHGPDVTNLVSRLTKDPTPGPGRPAADAIELGLLASNPEVRRIAARLIRILVSSGGDVPLSQPQH